ncbi:MAG: disulfide oxidoreductase [Caldilineaceae bacterium]
MESSASANRMGSWALYGALLAAWTAMLGSLYFSEVRGYVPCTLCWYQRILMYPLAGLIAFGILRRDRHLPLLVLPFSLLGQGVSTYHYLIQKTTIFGAPTACAAGVPCTTVWINWLGFITIPLLAMIAFLLITIAMITAYYSNQPDEESETPLRWPVVAVIAGALLLYGGVYAQAQAAKEAKAAALPVTVLAGTEHAEHNPVEPAAASPALEEGKTLYVQACAACHGADGAGIATLGNGFDTSAFMAESDDTAVLAMVRAGREPGAVENTSGVAMPASGGRPDLTDQQLAAIIGYIRSEFTQK